MAVRGIRGATTVDCDDSGAIVDATEELLREITIRNRLDIGEVASAFFTVTTDLHADFPARAARERMGWVYAALLNSVEIPVPGGLERCIRVLLHVNTELRQDEIAHVYLHKACVLRSDIRSEIA
ncbi:MAG TPA: chorismate mutase [Candidatus Baltobacteraceae bacterium]|jgi:chorismate mutase|nr:chorismate mutase [Candidatus Baltobacteraceae bacterium]